MTDLVSIITPLYNSERFVAATIESVLAQTYQHWEMIVIDDGSTDNSARIVTEYATRDPRIKLFSQPNAGSAAARNNGIRRAIGRYIALLDSDDLWEPNFLEEQIALLTEKNAALVCSSHKRIDENGKECLQPFRAPQRMTYNDLLKTCSISCLTGLYDSSKFGKIYLNEDFRTLRDDHIYWLTIAKKAGEAFGNQQILASYRMRSNSVSYSKRKVIIPQFRVYYESEKLGFWRSLYYLMHWAWNGYKKYRK